MKGRIERKRRRKRREGGREDERKRDRYSGVRKKTLLCGLDLNVSTENGQAVLTSASDALSNMSSKRSKTFAKLSL